LAANVGIAETGKVVRTMRITRMNRVSSVLLTAGLLGAGAGVLASASPAAESARVQSAAERPAGREVRADGLTLDEFDTLHKQLTRMATERVWSVPWQLSVREARELAARENKPIFLWISNNGGTHPLGPC
jgi:hypothetical protein